MRHPNITFKEASRKPWHIEAVKPLYDWLIYWVSHTHFVPLQQPQIVLLKEGTDTSQGKPQLVSNINACQSIVDAVRTTLGPRGMDKLIVDSQGKATISNDGATIMKLLEIIHPAAKTLVDIAKSQDAEVSPDV